MSKPWPITFDDVLLAQERVRRFLPVTALRSYSELDAALGCHVLVKHENHLPTQSFKVRNGVSVIAGLTDEERRRGVVAATMGNYGQGLAWSGRALGVKVTICTPDWINRDKLADMRGFGAEVHVGGKDYDDAIVCMNQLVKERGLIPVHGVNHPRVISGAATLTLEAVEQARELGVSIDAMFISIGGGSQAVGAMTVLRHHSLPTEVIAVQAEGAATIHDAWHTRTPGMGKAVHTFAEGIATRSTYEMTFDALLTGLKDFITVSDEQMAEAMRLMWRATHNAAEPAGAAGLAGLMKLRHRFAGKTVAVILSGSNVDGPTLGKVLNETAPGDFQR
jgi:threonine dehydratase